MIGPMVLDPLEQECCLSVQDKKKIYGKKNRIPVPADGSIGPDPAVVRNDEDVEPLSWHDWPIKFYLELIWRFALQIVIDLTPSSGKFAMSALQEKLGAY